MNPFLILCILFSYTLANEPPLATDVPTIGIVMQPENDQGGRTDYIEYRYVHYLNNAGARVIPISYKMSNSELRKIMNKINGIFVHGGSVDFVLYNNVTKKYVWTEFSNRTKVIYDIAKEINDKGVYFPVWGTCLGFQLLAFLASEDPLVPKEWCNCSGHNSNLTFTKDAYTSKLFSQFTWEEMQAFKEQALTFNGHTYYVDYLDFLKNPPLDNMFKILAHSPDREVTVTHVAAIEGRKYPFYGVQFHPEFIVYTGNNLSGEKRVKISQQFANFFVNETRRCPNKINRDEDLKLSIWNYPLKSSGSSFHYIFEN